MDPFELVEEISEHAGQVECLLALQTALVLACVILGWQLS